jgi:hypothetical protein
MHSLDRGGTQRFGGSYFSAARCASHDLPLQDVVKSPTSDAWDQRRARAAGGAGHAVRAVRDKQQTGFGHVEPHASPADTLLEDGFLPGSPMQSPGPVQVRMDSPNPTGWNQTRTPSCADETADVEDEGTPLPARPRRSMSLSEMCNPPESNPLRDAAAKSRATQRPKASQVQQQVGNARHAPPPAWSTSLLLRSVSVKPPPAAATLPSPLPTRRNKHGHRSITQSKPAGATRTNPFHDSLGSPGMPQP